MDIDKILERHYNNNGYIVDYKYSQFHRYSDFTKQAIKEIVEATIDMCAEDAKIETLYQPTGFKKWITQIDKESILKLKNKIKY